MNPQYREISHLTGATRYIPDLDVPNGTLTGYVVTAPYAHARLNKLDISPAAAMPGVCAVLCAADIPGTNQLGCVNPTDEHCLLPVGETCGYRGQAVCLIAAHSKEQAQAAAKTIVWEWTVLTPILTLEEAMAQQSFLYEPQRLNKGDQSAMSKAPLVAQGVVSLGGQEHFYFETQSAYAVMIGSHAMHVQSSTQNPTDTQRLIAQNLRWNASQVEVEAGYLGGGFGGKQAQGSWTACWASLLAYATKKPVSLVLSREEDMMMTGKRHAMEARWKIGFDEKGTILAYQVDASFDCGWCQDISLAVLCHCQFHLDSAYYLPSLTSTFYPCKTHKTSSTAFRGFGVPQAAAIIESAIESMAVRLGKDPAYIRLHNYYGIREKNTTHCNMKVKHNILRNVHHQMMQQSRYVELQKEVASFNKKHTYLKQGVGMVPIKFGIGFNESFLNQAGALLNVYADGTVLAHHAGTEMGQGLDDKMRLVIHRELGVPMEAIIISNTSTAVIPNTTSTAASTGTDYGGAALKDACDKIKKRLQPIACAMMDLPNGAVLWKDGMVLSASQPEKSISFKALAAHAYFICESLSEKGFFTHKNLGYDLITQQGQPYRYFVMGMSVAHIELNVLTGSFTIKDVWIIHDIGDHIDASIDMGQIMGAYMQGLGWCTMEKLITNKEGVLLTDSLDNYKIPGIYDLPERYHVTLYSGNPEPINIHNSRAIGEPPFLYALAVWFALQHAKGTSLPLPALKEDLLTNAL